jgi:hypothetical protein
MVANLYEPTSPSPPPTAGASRFLNILFRIKGAHWHAAHPQILPTFLVVVSLSLLLPPPVHLLG